MKRLLLFGSAIKSIQEGLFKQAHSISGLFIEDLAAKKLSSQNFVIWTRKKPLLGHVFFCGYSQETFIENVKLRIKLHWWNPFHWNCLSTMESRWIGWDWMSEVQVLSFEWTWNRSWMSNFASSAENSTHRKLFGTTVSTVKSSCVTGRIKTSKPVAKLLLSSKLR